jgi:hypothetical protein
MATRNLVWKYPSGESEHLRKHQQAPEILGPLQRHEDRVTRMPRAIASSRAPMWADKARDLRRPRGQTPRGHLERQLQAAQLGFESTPQRASNAPGGPGERSCLPSKTSCVTFASRSLLRKLPDVWTALRRPELGTSSGSLLNFSSNDYLGLATEPACARRRRRHRSFGVGSGASRLVCGTLAPHTKLEETLAKFKGTEAALSFSSGLRHRRRHDRRTLRRERRGGSSTSCATRRSSMARA